MREFFGLLQTREEQISGEVFELLVSFGDFPTFKEMMLAQKRMQSDSVMDLGLSITGKRLASPGQ